MDRYKRLENIKIEMSQRRNRLGRGSLTVEAILLMPMLVYLMIAFIYLDFWLYDQVIAEALCCQAAWMMQSEECEDGEATERMRNLMKNNLLMDEITEAACSTNMIWSQAECTLLSGIPFRGMRSLLGGTAGYCKEHVSIVSSLADVTMFRKLSHFEEEDSE